MRLGLIAVASPTGLGYQTRDYFEHLKPDKTLVVDISEHNGTKQNYGWYDGAQISKGFPKSHAIIAFLRGLDVVLLAETPFNFDVYEYARKMNVKVANVVNWEFFDHLANPTLPLPDLLIMPSVWHLKDAQRFAHQNGIKATYLHHPVDREKFPFRLRKTNVSMHIAGKPAVHDRNGTYSYLDAETNARIMTQSDDFAYQLRHRYRHANVFTDIVNPNELYDYGDFLVFPRRYGGNCLPLNEALSTGMPVIMTDIEPNNYLLPKEWLVETEKIDEFKPRTFVDIYEADGKALREKIEQFKTLDMKIESRKADKIADTISWSTLKPKWLETLKGLYEQA